MRFGKKWSYGLYTNKNGLKSFGTKLWFNEQRVGLEVDFYVWQVFLMRDF